jgi:hypothetical protein
MKNFVITAIVVVIMVGIMISIPPTQAESHISVKTDKNSYKIGDTINISGKFLDHIQINIFDPNKNLVKIFSESNAFQSFPDGNYYFTTDSNSWHFGEYKIILQSKGDTVTTTFHIENSNYPYKISDKNNLNDLYFRGNAGGINSECNDWAYHAYASIPSTQPNPIKIEFVDQHGKVAGHYEKTDAIDVEIDVNYVKDEIYHIYLHYKNEVYHVGSSSQGNTPSNMVQVECLASKEIIKQGLEYSKFNVIGDYYQNWENNKDTLEYILGADDFSFYESIIDANIVFGQRNDVDRIDSEYAIEQVNDLRKIIHNFSELILSQHLEIQKEVISKMDLSLDDKVDLVFDTKLNFKEKSLTYKNQIDIFMDRIIYQYNYLDQMDLQHVEIEQHEKKIEQEKEKIRQELEQSDFKEQLSMDGNKEKNISKKIALFVDQSKDLQHYIDRYNNEPTYKEWFDENYSQYSSIYEAVGLEEPVIELTFEPIPESVVEIPSTPNCGTGTESVNGICQVIQTEEKSSKGGGCLIATATYGSEMAFEVQQLRELRDNTLLNTESGTQFMGMFNEVYYSFSPVIADYERENPYFKETVKLAITPMISSLSILNYVEMDSEESVLGYGISLILLNLGMYLGVPAVLIVGIRKIK